jgi:hypothetical protein
MRIVISGIILTIIGLALTGSVSCQTKPFPLGDYRYSGYDKNGAKIVEGTISITSRQSNHISGKWELKSISNTENISFELGKGRFEGEMEQNNATINLNPNINDANLFLVGKIEGSRFHGVWRFSSIKGVVDRGTFEAIKK